MAEFWQEIVSYGANIDFLEFAGAVFGLLTVWFLIKENILTWPAGITYVLISFVIFYRIRLYADLALHFFFLVLNIYGWYYWTKGKQKVENELAVPSPSVRSVSSHPGAGYWRPRHPRHPSRRWIPWRQFPRWLSGSVDPPRLLPSWERSQRCYSR